MSIWLDMQGLPEDLAAKLSNHEGSKVIFDDVSLIHDGTNLPTWAKYRMGGKTNLSPHELQKKALGVFLEEVIWRGGLTWTGLILAKAEGEPLVLDGEKGGKVHFDYVIGFYNKPGTLDQYDNIGHADFLQEIAERVRLDDFRIAPIIIGSRKSVVDQRIQKRDYHIVVMGANPQYNTPFSARVQNVRYAEPFNSKILTMDDILAEHRKGPGCPPHLCPL